MYGQATAEQPSAVSNPQLHRLVESLSWSHTPRQRKLGSPRLRGGFQASSSHTDSLAFFDFEQTLLEFPSVSGTCVSKSGFGPSAEAPCVRECLYTTGTTHICGRMRDLIQGFGEMKGKTLIKISFKTHQDFFFYRIQISSHPKIML